jgi:hypothetical protein
LFRRIALFCLYAVSMVTVIRLSLLNTPHPRTPPTTNNSN